MVYGKDVALLRHYFNHVYTPFYDFTTASLATYEKLQNSCIGALELNGAESILCVGVGTGNEIIKLHQQYPGIGITGVDYSPKALKIAAGKSVRAGQPTAVAVMDAGKLGFANGVFDTVLCIHVTDFVPDITAVTQEIIRVLKNGGSFVITYPSSPDSISFGTSLIKSGFHKQSLAGKNTPSSFFNCLVRIPAMVIYTPLMLRFRKKSYTRESLEAMLYRMNGITFTVQEFRGYNDFIVSGKKFVTGE